MTYLLDTNAWIRFFNQPEEINPTVRNLLSKEHTLALSPFSIIEVCQKVSIGKLKPGQPLNEWLTNATNPEWIKLLPITSAIAQQAYSLEIIHPKTGKPHKDPADLIIAATAQVHDLTIVTSDEVLLSASFLRTLSTR